MTDFYDLSEEILLEIGDEIENKDENSIFEADYADGILNILVFATKQQYVINRHNANQKIWFSSPVSGADYFSYDQERKEWRSDKGSELKEKLYAELNSFDDFNI